MRRFGWCLVVALLSVLALGQGKATVKLKNRSYDDFVIATQSYRIQIDGDVTYVAGKDGSIELSGNDALLRVVVDEIKAWDVPPKLMKLSLKVVQPGKPDQNPTLRSAEDQKATLSLSLGAKEQVGITMIAKASPKPAAMVRIKHGGDDVTIMLHDKDMLRFGVAEDGSPELQLLDGKGNLLMSTPVGEGWSKYRGGSITFELSEIN